MVKIIKVRLDVLNVAILGTGQIGTDLAVKVSARSEFRLILVAGRRLDSPGLKFLSEKNFPISERGIDAILESPDHIDIVFDCTSAADHIENWPRLRSLGISAIDLTPAKIGSYFIPRVTSLVSHISGDPININLVTCGGQATAPIIHAIRGLTEMARVEVASNIASLSAGPATRANLDEYITTTERVLKDLSGAQETKAILILNPATPPITMQNTIYINFLNNAEVDESSLNQTITSTVRRIQRYVPGLRLAMKPTFSGSEFVISVLVRGHGDYLPPYSGNLDIINSAAIEAALELSISQNGNVRRGL